jgi:hypothetical protein
VGRENETRREGESRSRALRRGGGVGDQLQASSSLVGVVKGRELATSCVLAILGPCVSSSCQLVLVPLLDLEHSSLLCSLTRERPFIAMDRRIEGTTCTKSRLEARRPSADPSRASTRRRSASNMQRGRGQGCLRETRSISCCGPTLEDVSGVRPVLIVILPFPLTRRPASARPWRNASHKTS